MGLNKFEKTIKDNQEYFDKEPSMEHMDKFLFKLREQEETINKKTFGWKRNSSWLVIAASISILIGIAWVFQQQKPPAFENPQMGLSLELTDVKTYYSHNSNKKLQEIKSCSDQSENSRKLIETTKIQLLKLDFNTEKIENKLKEASGNKRLELAYIQNLKAKNDLLNNMQAQICSKKNILTQ